MSKASSETQYFDADEFKFNVLLGEGRTKVYLDKYKSQSVALKVADISKHRNLLSELLNEISIYDQLLELQGSRIPTLVCHGYIEDILYGVCISPCGIIPGRLDDRQRITLLETLDFIHHLGILHNDLKRENLLVDEFGSPFIIDFGFATNNCVEEQQLEEREHFIAVLNSFAV
jgi:serine/threonine protein kinase